MAPPTYPDLGKLANDTLTKGYHIGFWRFDCNTKTKSEAKLTTFAKMSPTDKTILGSVGATHALADYGLEFVEKLNIKADHYTFLGEVSCQDKIAEGLKLTLQGSVGFPFSENLTLSNISPGGKVKLGYGMENLQFNADCSIETKPKVGASIVLGYEGFLVGYETVLNAAEIKPTLHSITLGYTTPEIEVTVGLAKVLNAEVANDKVFASFFNHTFENFDLGLEASAETNDLSKVNIECGIKYQLEDSSIRAKVNTDLEGFLGYQIKLHEGIQMFLSACSTMKLGLAFELEL